MKSQKKFGEKLYQKHRVKVRGKKLIPKGDTVTDKATDADFAAKLRRELEGSK